MAGKQSLETHLFGGLEAPAAVMFEYASSTGSILLSVAAFSFGAGEEDLEGNFSHELLGPYTYTEGIHVKRKKEKEKGKKI